MPKALCITALAISILVLILFVADLLLLLANARSAAPLHGENIVLDVVFALAATVLGYLSWVTFRKQV
jgi:hypothetical protein